MLSVISSNDKYSLALFLETHLPLIKSRALFQLYDNLRYERDVDYQKLISILEEESKVDYRLSRLLEKFIQKFTKV